MFATGRAPAVSSQQPAAKQHSNTAGSGRTAASAQQHQQGSGQQAGRQQRTAHRFQLLRVSFAINVVWSARGWFWESALPLPLPLFSFAFVVLLVLCFCCRAACRFAARCCRCRYSLLSLLRRRSGLSVCCLPLRYHCAAASVTAACFKRPARRTSTSRTPRPQAAPTQTRAHFRPSFRPLP